MPYAHVYRISAAKEKKLNIMVPASRRGIPFSALKPFVYFPSSLSSHANQSKNPTPPPPAYLTSPFTVYPSIPALSVGRTYS